MIIQNINPHCNLWEGPLYKRALITTVCLIDPGITFFILNSTNHNYSNSNKEKILASIKSLDNSPYTTTCEGGCGAAARCMLVPRNSLEPRAHFLCLDCDAEEVLGCSIPQMRRATTYWDLNFLLHDYAIVAETKMAKFHIDYAKAKVHETATPDDPLVLAIQACEDTTSKAPASKRRKLRSKVRVTKSPRRARF